MRTVPQLQRSGPPLAWSDGGPLRVPPGAATTLVAALRSAAMVSPPRGVEYVRDDGATITQTYAELLAAAGAIAASLRDAGLHAGDKLLLQIGAAHEFLPAFWGCVLAGVVPVPAGVPPAYDQPHAAVRRLCEARRLLGNPKVLTTAPHATALRALVSAEGGHADDVVVLPGPGAARTAHGSDAAPGNAAPANAAPGDAAPRDAAPDDVALVLLTSGTSGTPKAVCLQHRNLLGQALAAAQRNGFTAAGVSLNWMPLDHVGGLVMFHIRDVVTGCRQVQVPTDLILRAPLRWLDFVHEYRATVTWAPNFAFALVNQQAASMPGRAWDLRCMRFILNGGEAIAARTAREFLEHLAPFGLPATAMHPAWGMSETSSGVTYSDQFAAAGAAGAGPVDVGAPIPGVMLRIVDAQDEVVREGTEGALQVQGVPVTREILSASGPDTAAFAPGGWLRTGDLGVLRDGRLTITGRQKDVIIVHGVNYAHAELEAIVETVPGIQVSFTAVCAVRSPGDDTDRVVVFAAATPAGAASRDELAGHIRAAMAVEAGVVPAAVVLLRPESIPKTAIGKIRIAELKARYEAGEFAPPATPLHRRVWRKTAEAAPGMLDNGPWLVLADAQGLGAAFVRRLVAQGGVGVLVTAGARFEAIGPGRFVVDPTQPEHFDRLHAALRAQHITLRRSLHLWSYGPDPQSMPEGGAVPARVAGIAGVLLHVQALARAGGGRQAHQLWVVSNHAWDVLPGESVAPERSALAGLVRTLPLELPWLTCAHVDLAAVDVESDLAALERELGGGGEHAEVAYREGRRRHVRLEPVGGDADAGRNGADGTAGACYVVTGGLGGIGHALVAQLLARPRTQVLVLGRTPPQAVRDHVDALAGATGRLEYVCADVADTEAVQAAVGAAEARWGRALDGIFHLAGVYAPRPLLEESPASFHAALRAKMDGAWVLHRLIAHRPGVLMVHFASVLGAFGGAHAGLYAAANAFLMGLAHHQRALGLRSHCLLWSQWADTGMSREAGTGAALAGKGFLPLAPDQALQTLWRTLESGHPHLLIGLDAGNLHVRAQMQTPPGIPPAAYTAGAATRTPAERRVAHIWEELLGIHSIGRDDNFFAVGGDSLLAIRVVAQIEAAFGIALPVNALFRSPTVAQIAAQLAPGHTGDGVQRVLELRPGAAAPPLFCVAGAGDTADVFADLAAALTGTHALWGLEALPSNWLQPDAPPLTVEGVAAELVMKVRAVQPHGPYMLAGHCLGGLFAYEAAQQLRTAGDQVALVALIETLRSDSLPIPGRAPLGLRWAAQRRELALRSWRGQCAYVLRKIARYPGVVRTRRRMRRALRPLVKMYARYTLAPYSGRIAVVVAADSFYAGGPGQDPRLQWTRWAAGGADVLTAAGDHESLLRRPFVDDLAAQLERLLDRAAPAI